MEQDFFSFYDSTQAIENLMWLGSETVNGRRSLATVNRSLLIESLEMMQIEKMSLVCAGNLMHIKRIKT